MFLSPVRSKPGVRRQVVPVLGLCNHTVSFRKGLTGTSRVRVEGSVGGAGTDGSSTSVEERFKVWKEREIYETTETVNLW